MVLAHFALLRRACAGCATVGGAAKTFRHTTIAVSETVVARIMLSLFFPSRLSSQSNVT